MAIPSKPSYSHGSTGTQPGQSIDYANGDPVDESEFDYYIHTLFSKIKALIDALETLDSDDDGVVDAADGASTYSKGGAEQIEHPTDVDFIDKFTVTDDGDGTVSIETSALDEEEVEDAVNALLTGGDKVSTSYDDAADTLTINTSSLDEEEVEDAVAALISGGTNITVSYNDSNDTLTVDTSALNQEEVEDTVDALLVGGSGVTLTYDDAAGSLTIDGLTTSDVTSSNWNDYEIQKNGTDGSGILNFKTP